MCCAKQPRLPSGFTGSKSRGPKNTQKTCAENLLRPLQTLVTHATLLTPGSQEHTSARVCHSDIPPQICMFILGWNGHGMLKNRSLVLVLVLRTVFCAPGPLVGPRRSLLARSDAGQQTASAANSNNRARRDAGPHTTSISQLAVMQGSFVTFCDGNANILAPRNSFGLKLI